MGDAIELSISKSGLKNIFYKITSSAITFEVKGDSCAAVGLARKPVEECKIWIVVLYIEIYIVINGKVFHNLVGESDFVSDTDFRKFWISWHSNRLLFGRHNNVKPLFFMKLITEDLQYITFSVHSQIDKNVKKLHWKLFMPPKLERPLIKKIENGDMHWVKADNQLPDEALIGGFESEVLYLIRAPHRGSLTPGKFVPSEGVGFVPWGGGIHEKHEFEVLCGYNCIWVKTCDNKIPVGAVEGGYSEDNHETLYVGRAEHDDHIIPGKVQPSHSVCYIPCNNQEIAKKDYEVLVDPQKNMKYINRCYVSNTDFYNLLDSFPVSTDIDNEHDVIVLSDQDNSDSE